MIRDITIGQYYPAESPIQRIDARVKTVITLLYIISLFVINSFVGYAVVIASLAVTIKMSRVPFKFMIRGLRSLVLIIIFTAVINLLVTEGETPLLTIWRFTVTLEGVFFAIKMCLGIILLIVGSSLLTLTTTPIKLTDGIESLLKPLEKIGVPAHDIAMMMTIALRFIPTLLDETDKIIKAQREERILTQEALQARQRRLCRYSSRCSFQLSEERKSSRWLWRLAATAEALREQE